MATSLRLDVNLQLIGTWAKTSTDSNFGEASKPISKQSLYSLTNGTGSGNADLWYSATGLTAIAAGADYDLAGVLSNDYSTLIAFATVKGILIHNRSSTGTDTIYAGGKGTAAALNMFDANTSYIKILGGETFIKAGSITGITIGSADILKIQASVATITFDMAVWGVSA